MRRWNRLLIEGLTILSAIGGASRASEEILVRHGEVGYDRTTTIGAFVLVQAGGRVQDCYVKPGDRVKAGQVLGRLHDRDAVHELQRLWLEAEGDADERLGIAKNEVAVVKLRRAEVLRQRSAISDEELLLARLEVKTTELEIESARHRRKGAELQRKRMEAEIRSREFVSPHDGVVVEILKNVGESCICNEAVLKVVHDDVLWVTGMADVADAWRLRPGQSARIRPEVEGAEVAIESRVFPGKVVFVDPRIDPLTRTCKFVVEVDNRDHDLRAGIEAEIFIDLGPAGEEAPAAHPAIARAPGELDPGAALAAISKNFLRSLRVAESRPKLIPEGPLAQRTEGR